MTIKNFKTVLRKSLLFLLIFSVVISILVIPYMTLLDKQIPNVFSRLMQDIISLLPVLLASWVMTKYCDKTTLKSIGLRNEKVFTDISIGTVIAIFWVILSVGGLYLFGVLVKNSENTTLSSSFFIYAFALLINAAAQEILCRGYLFQIIRNYVGIKSAFFATSILFMCMHAGALQAGIIPSLNVFGAGLIFAFAYYKTGNLWMPITIHFIWNFICGSILFTPVSGYEGLRLFQLKGNELLAGGRNGIEASIITTVTIIIVIAIVHFFIKQRQPIE